MTASQIMLLIAIVIYWIYTVAMFRMFGVPESYSDTFYKLNDIKKWLGILFPIMLISTTALVMPSWLEQSDKILPNLTFLAFFGGAGLLFIAVAPFFKECTRDTGHPIKDLIYRSFHGQGLVHTIGALMSMIATVVWTACSPYWWVILSVIAITLITGFSTSSLKRSSIFWFEFMVFNTIFIAMSFMVTA